MSKPTEYLCQIDSGVIPSTLSAWAVLAPNAIYWNPSVSTAGVMSVVDTDIPNPTHFVFGMNGEQWQLTISNPGVLSFNDTGTPLAASDTIVVLVDSNSVTWLLAVNLDGQLVLTTETPLENKYYYPAIVVSFETGAANDKFELHAVKPNTTRHRR